MTRDITKGLVERCSLRRGKGEQKRKKNVIGDLQEGGNGYEENWKKRH